MEDFIDKYKHNQHFNVPDGYFENLPDLVIQRAKQEEKKYLTLHRRRKWFAIAAAILAICAVGTFLWRDYISFTNDKNIAQNHTSQSQQLFAQNQTVEEIQFDAFCEEYDDMEYDDTDYEMLSYYSDEFTDTEIWDE